MKRKLMQLTLLLLMVPVISFAQGTGVIKGKITDKKTGEPLVGASVLIKGTYTGTITDANGNYQLTKVKAGSFDLVAQFISYNKVQKSVTVKDGQTATVNFALSQDLIGLDQVVVTGVVNPKSAINSSVSLTSLKPKAMEEFSATTTAELFKNIPGVHSESTGGEGNANISVRGVPISTGGAKFLQLQEDGMPVMQFGDISFGNADIFLRSDQTVARVEALKGGSASTLASNSPAGIINFISKTGVKKGGSIGTTIGLDYQTFRTDFDYGAPLGNGFRFNIGGFYREGVGPRNAGFTANKGGQIKANFTKEFDKGYVRLYLKHLNDRAISYMPMPVMVTGTGSNPTYKSIPGFDLKHAALQSPYFIHQQSVDANGNSRSFNMADGMHPISDAVGAEFNFDLGNGWTVHDRGQLAFNHGSFNSPFPVSLKPAQEMATSLAGAGATLSYANGANAGTPLTQSQLSNLNGNGLLMLLHTFDVQLNNLDNFTNDVHISKQLDNFHVTAGYYHASQRIAMTWLWQTYLTDVQNQPRLVNVASADSSFYSEGGLTAHGVPAWGNCCTRGYDMTYTIDAPYANMGVDVTDKLNVDASVRYDMGDAFGYYLGNEQAQVDVNKDGKISPVEQSVTVLDNSNPHPVSYSYHYVSYSVGANYKFDAHKAVFARYSKGGRANADRLLYTPFITAAGKTVKGLSNDGIKQAELGFKYNSPVAGIFLTGFYNHVDEQNTEFNKIINNKYKSYGAELETVIRTGNLNINSGGTFTKAEITKSLTADNVGNTPRRVPTLMYNISPSYTIGKGALGMSLVGTTKVYSQDDNSVVLPGFAYVNAFANYAITKGLSLRVNVNNLTNTLGFTEMEADPFTNNSVNYMRARPITGRATTMTVTYSF